MKERVISAGVGLVVLAVVVAFYDTLLFNIVMGAVSVIAVFELLNATKTIKNRGLAALVSSFSFLLPFVQHQYVRPFAPIIIFVVAVLFFLLVLKNHDIVNFSEASMMFLVGLFVPLFFCSAVYLRDSAGAVRGLYYLLLSLGSAWLCDTGAYFSGYFFGKTKLAPKVSPKKTIEGAIGGVLTAVALNLALALGYTKLMEILGHSIQINYIIIGIASVFLAGLGMLGDLVASVIKRQYSVKDYGHIMPGHGGVMDRFDSVLLTLPAVYILTLYLPVAL